MMFTITIEQFEGPLDLMLYLVKEKKLDLFDLDISQLIEQYQAYLNQMQQQKFEIATEYISEFAGLIEYKSKKLIPTAKVTYDPELEEEPMSIVDRLLAYEQAKKVSSILKDRYEKRLQLLSKPPSIFNGTKPIVGEHKAEDLFKAFNKVMQRLKISQPFDIKTTPKELSVADRVNHLRHVILGLSTTFTLDDLFEKTHDLQEMIVTFLAILDMIRLNELSFTVEEDVVYLQRSDYEQTNH
jgi:segregation and condensation protein A